VVRYDIKKISATAFVAAEVDESTDVTNKAQISVVPVDWNYRGKSKRKMVIRGIN